MSANATSARRLPAWASRWILNLGLLLSFTLVYSIVSSVIAVFIWLENYPPGLVLYGWLLTSYLLLPGALLYLGLLEFLPRGWSRLTRRATAMALSPLVGASLWFYFMPADELLGAWRLAILTPLVYGLVARLREPRG